MSLSFNQLATVLNEINAQATGTKGIAPVDYSSFVSVAQTTLLTGYDNVINAVSQVLSRTIFSIRPYSRKFAGLYMDSQQWGNHIRKLSAVDGEAYNDQRYKDAWTGVGEDPGATPTPVKGTEFFYVDQQKIYAPGVLQTNFYGAQVYQRALTVFRDQLDVAFSSPDEFGRFISMVMQNVSDLIEKDHEDCARATVANFIAGKIEGDSDNVFHMVTLYNEAAGTALTADTVRQPENFVPFMKWAYSFIRTKSDLMTERTTKFHINVNGKPVARHTPKEMQKLYLYASDINEMESSVLSSVFNPEFLQGMDFEKVNYWQSIDTPMGIQCKPVYMDETGAAKVADNNVTQSNVFGVLFDAEAMGITTVNQWSAPAPFNAAGGYTTTYWHYTDRFYNDFTENGMVFIMD